MSMIKRVMGFGLHCGGGDMERQRLGILCGSF